jgi:beta-N-acetylhexosaminidase
MSLRATTALTLLIAPCLSAAPVMYGMDVLMREELGSLEGKRVAVCCNHTAVTYEGEHLLDALHREGVNIAAIFAAEHGIRGTEHTTGSTATDEATGAPIYSLYDDTREPLPEELDGVDVFLFDLPDIGCRFYTYISTMAHVIEGCAKAGVEVVILDRPNPISGRHPEGAIAVEDVQRGFTSFYPIPTRHGLTTGEIALMAVGEGWLNLPDGGVDMRVIPAQHWTRAVYGDSIDREFIRPSPNISGVEAALTYPGVGLFESTPFSAGRGTMIPFLIMGTPFIDAEDYCARLTSYELPGVEFMPATWTPEPNAGIPARWLKYNGEECGGVFITVTDREIFRPVMTGTAMVWTVYEMYPEESSLRDSRRSMDTMFGDPRVYDMTQAMVSGESTAMGWRELVDSWEGPVEAYWAKAQEYMLYE